MTVPTAADTQTPTEEISFSDHMDRVIDSNWPAVLEQQKRLFARGIVDEHGNLIKRDPPPDMQPGSGCDVGG